ncbi:MAG: tetratricopeptide repeat protein, partial [Kiloniellales bacterium]
YEHSLALQEKTLARSQSSIAKTTVELALVYESTDRIEKARKLYQRVLVIWQPALGRNHPSVVTARKRFAVLIEPGIARPSPPTVAPAPPPPGAEYRIHLTSIRKQKDAAREWSRLQRLYPNLLKSLSLTVIRADLGSRRGIYYRIQGGPLTQSEAVAVCAAFTARKVWCAVVRGVRPVAPPTVATATPTTTPRGPTRAAPPSPVPSRPALSRPAPSRPLGASEFRIHLTSIRNPDHARREWARLKRLYPELLRGLALKVVRIDLGSEKGIYFRIQGGPLDRDAARALCAAFAARQVWCRVVRPGSETTSWLPTQHLQRGRRRPPRGGPVARWPGPPRKRGRIPVPEPGSRRVPSVHRRAGRPRRPDGQQQGSPRRHEVGEFAQTRRGKRFALWFCSLIPVPRDKNLKSKVVTPMVHTNFLRASSCLCVFVVIAFW